MSGLGSSRITSYNVCYTKLLRFKKCVDFRLWGSKNTLNHWNKGDYLAFKVGDFLLGIAEVTGDAFFEDKVVWENGVFSNRS